jgi:hypothetical protein
MADLDVLGPKPLDFQHPINEAVMNSKTTMATIRHREEKQRFTQANKYYLDCVALTLTIRPEDVEDANFCCSEAIVYVEAELIIVARA